MIETAKDTEQKILDAAKTVFYRKGLKGARMQEIADEAGINRALLNYYFRTKGKLYDKVVMETVKDITPAFESSLLETLNLKQFVEVMVNFLIDNTIKQPDFQTFYVITLNENPEMLLSIFKNRQIGYDPMDTFIQKIETAIENKEIRRLNPEQLIWSILSMCSYPFMMRPIIQSYKDKSEMEMNAFFVQRKQEIVDLVWNGIRV